jgi:Zn-dependent protease
VLAGIFGLALRVLLSVASPDLTDRVLSDGYVTSGVASDGFAHRYLAFGHGGAEVVLYLFLAEAFFINVVLFLFNSIPIPPLDGYAVARGLFGHIIPELFRWVDRNRQMVTALAFVVIVALPLATGGSSNPLWSTIMRFNNSMFSSVVGATPFLGADLPRLWMLFPPQGQ